VIRYGASFNGRSSVRTWLYRILINRCRSTTKKEGKRPKSRQADPPQEAGQQTAATASPDEDSRDLHAAVSQLTAAKREVLLLCYHADLTHEQAAKILRIPPGTLKSRLHAALEELRQHLGTEGRS
jgi:RNA polymerase sigma-70 factor (ECF subfamily)